MTPEARKKRNEAVRRWIAKNPEKIAAYRRRYYDVNYERIRERAKEAARKRRQERPEYDADVARRYRERHPDRSAESAKRYRQKHREERAVQNKAWRDAHPEYTKEQAKKRLERNPTIHAERYAHNKDRMQIAALQWRKDNPDKARDINSRSAHRRRAERNNSDEHYTLTQLRALREKSGGRCAYCDTKGRMTIDHIVSLRQGGSNSIRNIQFLCKPCNSAKQDKNPIVFAQEKGLLL